MEIRVKVADLAVCTSDNSLATIGLGSCVAIALHDPQAKVGGLAHILLPSESLSRERDNLAKFPGTAVPVLVREMVKLGALQRRIVAKIAGGASMFGALLPSGGMNVGERNVASVKEALSVAGIPLVAEDTGSDYGRSVYFFVDDGRVEVRSLKRGNRVL